LRYVSIRQKWCATRTVKSFVTELFLTLRGRLTTTPLHNKCDMPRALAGANFVVNGANAARGDHQLRR
jgi:hypothetical protein